MKDSNPIENESTENEVIAENSPENNVNSESAETADNSQTGELLKIQEELAGSKDKYLRLYSEFENFRRRTAKEKIDMIQNANEQVVKSLLPVVDDFERAEKSIQDKNNKDVEGLLLIQNKFKKILEQAGVKVMEVERGSDFNADFHEAITSIPAPEEKLKGKVVDVVEKGFLLNDKVIRFAKVVIGG